MRNLVATAIEIQNFLEEKHWKYCIIMKAFANRPIDWADIEGIIIRQQAKLDWNRIFENLSSLCELKGEPEIVSKLSKLRDNSVT